MEQIKKYELLAEGELGLDLKGAAEKGAFWASKKTKCHYAGKCLHWIHCNEEAIENLDSTLKGSTKLMASIGNLLADGIIFIDNNFAAVIKGLEIIQKQDQTKINPELIKTIQENHDIISKEFEQLKIQLNKLSDKETSKFDELREQNEKLIREINEINISRLEKAIINLNKKIPNIEPIFEEFRKTYKTLEAIGRAIGYEE